MQTQDFNSVSQALRDPAVRRACRDNPDQALDTLRARGFDLPDLGLHFVHRFHGQFGRHRRLRDRRITPRPLQTEASP